MPVNFNITNQLASPAIYASSFATRPAPSFIGRLFVDTNTPSTGIYRDTGTVWIAVAGSAAEAQSLNDVCVVGNSTTTLGINIFGITAIGQSGGIQILPQASTALTIGDNFESAESLFVAYNAIFNTTARINTSLTTPLLIGGDTTTSTLTYRTTSAAGITGARHIFQVGNNGATEAMTILNNANVLIGTTTDSGFKLDVNGTARLGALTGTSATFSSSVTATSLIKSGGTSAQYLMADGSVSTLTNPVTGTGTTNYVAKFTSGTAVGNSNLINDASGNLGLGVTPSAWNSNYKAINIGNAGFIYGRTVSDQFAIGINWYRDGAGAYLYQSNGFATYYEQSGGTHAWNIAASGTAGNAVSFTQAMTLGANGNLLIGTTDAGYKFDVSGTGRFSSSVTTGAPSGGTAKPFKIGAAATVTPTAQNRTIEIEIDGVTYYLTAKTTNN